MMQQLLILIQAGIVINVIVERYTFGWRVSVSLQILIGLVLALGSLFLYETPRYKIGLLLYNCYTSIAT